MAKRLECTLCTERPGERFTRTSVNPLTQEQKTHPLFRSKRRLAKHLIAKHKDNPGAQREARQLLEMAKEVLRKTRGGK